MNLRERFCVQPGEKVKLSAYNPGDTAGIKGKTDARRTLKKNIQRLDELQYLLYAENEHALLIVLQGLDASGKDGTIRHVMGGLNPQGCTVKSFKKPSAEELDHDFLWRIYKGVPRCGDIGIFNRSHYEDVLVVRVHELVPKKVWSGRYGQINALEKILHDNNVTVVKFFLHISKEEQKKRFEQRLRDENRHWKISAADFAERKYWSDYTKAYEEAITRCSTKWAPWYIIPANRKWFRNLAVSEIIVETLEEMEMSFPRPSIDVSKIQIE